MNERVREWIAPGIAIGSIFVAMAGWILNLRDTVRDQATELAELKTVQLIGFDGRLKAVELLKLDSLNDRLVKLETYHDHWIDHLVNKMAAAQSARDDRLGITASMSAAKVYGDAEPADAMMDADKEDEATSPK